MKFYEKFSSLHEDLFLRSAIESTYFNENSTHALIKHNVKPIVYIKKIWNKRQYHHAQSEQYVFKFHYYEVCVIEFAVFILVFFSLFFFFQIISFWDFFRMFLIIWCRKCWRYMREIVKNGVKCINLNLAILSRILEVFQLFYSIYQLWWKKKAVEISRKYKITYVYYRFEKEIP